MRICVIWRSTSLQGCLANSPHDCIGNYVVRYVLEEQDGKLRPAKVVRTPYAPVLTSGRRELLLLDATSCKISAHGGMPHDAVPIQSRGTRECSLVTWAQLSVLQDAFPFVTHDLAMSLDGEILYGLDDPALSGGAKAIRYAATSASGLRVRTAVVELEGVGWQAGPAFGLSAMQRQAPPPLLPLYISSFTLGCVCRRQLNLTTMVPLPAFVVRADSTCSALAAGGPQGPIVACHGEDHPINSEPVRLCHFAPILPFLWDRTPS